MKVDSEYSINFYSTELNQVKYNKLLLKANTIREFKNKISIVICQNPLDFIQLSKNDFLMKYNTQITNLVGREIQPALTDIYTTYQNKIEDFNHKNRTQLQDNIKITYYKKSTKKNKKGELKSFKISFKYTDFTKVISYLVKYYNDNTVNYIITEINNTNILPDKLKFYNNILYYLDKFGERLIKLVYFKRKNILDATFSEPINFKA